MTNSPGDTRFPTWIVATIVFFFVAVVVGFIWLPAGPPGASGMDLWNVICRAIGLPERTAQDATLVGSQPASNVAWTVATREQLTRRDAVGGAALATTCNNRHGVNGVSTDAAFPNLVGQDVAALYKQLEDFRSRKRDATVMGVYVDSLSPKDVLDIATHFDLENSPRSADVRSG